MTPDSFPQRPSLLRSIFILFLGWVFLLSSTLAATEQVTYLHTDISGSPIAATDATGNVLWRESYRGYGERWLNQPASAPQDLWFHGKELDATGLQYFGARYYDPAVGRFTGIDPVGFQDGNLHSFNRYAYGNNNPVKYLDPDGNHPILGLLGFGGFLLWIETGAEGPPGLGAVGAVGKAAQVGQKLTPVATAVESGIASGAYATAAKGVASIEPTAVRFSQSSIKKNFSDGGSVNDLAAALRTGASDVPAIRLVERDSVLFTLDNRRLEAFRRAGVKVPYQMATPAETAAESWKFTTRNGGTSIRVRGE